LELLWLSVEFELSNDFELSNAVAALALGCLWRDPISVLDFSAGAGEGRVLAKFWFRNSLSAASQSSISLPGSHPRCS
jgi:hypothetical protein